MPRRPRKHPSRSDSRKAIGPDGLTPKQALFVREYLVDLNATQAYIRAGYARKTAATCAARLLTNARISAALQKGLQTLLARQESTAERVIEELVMIAHSDIRRVANGGGGIVPLEALPDSIARAVSSFKTTERMGTEKMPAEVTREVRLWDKNTALGNLARYHKLLTEKVEHSGQVEVSHAHLDALSIEELQVRSAELAAKTAGLVAQLRGRL